MADKDKQNPKVTQPQEEKKSVERGELLEKGGLPGEPVQTHKPPPPKDNGKKK